MINGHLSEAKQGFALLDDVDEDTFVRFIRWTYSKDYPAPEHTVVHSDSGSAKSTPVASKPDPAHKVVPTLADPDDWGSFGTKKEKKKKKCHVSKSGLKESFISQYDSPWADAMPPPRSNRAPHEDYTEVFLSHARLYVFAEKYDIQPLKKLSLQKLQHTLAIYTLWPERVEDILTLLKYVYANTAESIDGIEDIRTMLAHYIGGEMDVLIRDGEIRDLMLDDAEMLGDFLKMFALRIS